MAQKLSDPSAKFEIKRQFHQCGEDNGPQTQESEFAENLQKNERKERDLLIRIFHAINSHHHHYLNLCDAKQIKEGKNAKFKLILGLYNTRDEIELIFEKLRDQSFLQSTEKLGKRTLRNLQRYIHQSEKCSLTTEDLLSTACAVDNLLTQIYKIKLRWQKHERNSTIPPEKYQGRICALCSRLHSIHVRFNQLSVVTRNLRQDIAHLMYERKQFFDGIHNKGRLLYLIKMKQMQYSNKAYLTYEVLDEARDRISDLYKHNHKDNIEHFLLLGDQRRVAHNFWDIHRFNYVKNLPRAKYMSEEQEVLQRINTKVRRYSRMAACFIKAFQNLRTFQYPFDADKLLHKYIFMEDSCQKVMRLNLILNMEVRSIRDEVLELQRKNMELKREQRIRLQEKRKKRKSDVAVLNASRVARENLRQEFENQQFKISEMEKNLWYLFTLAGGDKEAMKEMLGSSYHEGRPILPYLLRGIENKCRSLQAQAYELDPEADQSAYTKAKSIFVQRIFKPQPQGGPFAPNIYLSPLLEITDDEDFESKLFSTRVFHQKELREYCMDKMRERNREGSRRGTSAEVIVSRRSTPSQPMTVSASGDDVSDALAVSTRSNSTAIKGSVAFQR